MKQLASFSTYIRNAAALLLLGIAVVLISLFVLRYFGFPLALNFTQL